jgi:peptidoglycan/LPS O-acetylase OafA/YrhL
VIQVNQVNSSKLSYRAEVDGLRAIAVVSVILYHAQMVLFGSDWFEGGFIGVDIFFVISGYLITRIILSELQSKGSFSFLNFHERRARRILPMLFIVIFVSIPYAWQKLLPSDLVE